MVIIRSNRYSEAEKFLKSVHYFLSYLQWLQLAITETFEFSCRYCVQVLSIAKLVHKQNTFVCLYIRNTQTNTGYKINFAWIRPQADHWQIWRMRRSNSRMSRIQLIYRENVTSKSFSRTCLFNYDVFQTQNHKQKINFPN